MPDDKTVEILIKFGLDDKAAKEAAKSLDKLKSSTTGSKQELSGATMAMKELVAQGARLLTVGAILNTLSGAVRNYVAQAGTSETSSRKWMENTQLLDNAWVRVGRTLTEKILPIYTTLAQLAFLITNEAGAAALLDAVLGPGSGDKDKQMRDAYAALSPEEMARVASQPGNVGENAIAAANRKKATQNQLTANLGIAGAGGANQIAPTEGGKSSAGRRGGESAQDRYYTLEQLTQFRSFFRAQEQAQIAHDRTLFTMDRDFKKSEEYAIKDYNRMRMRSNRDFQIQMQFSEKEFYRERAIIARDFGIQMVRNEQDFQRTRSRSQQDHEFELYQIAMSGDAMQYWLSERAFKIQQQRAEEDYNINKNRAKEDLDRQMADSELSFQIQRAQAVRERQIMLDDQAVDFEIQRERAKYQYDLSLKDLKWSFDQQAVYRKQAFMDQYTTMQTDEEAMRALRRQFTEYQYNEFVAMMEAGYAAVDLIKSYYSTPYGGSYDPYGVNDPNIPAGAGSVYQHAQGGYTHKGYAYLHDDEFVLDKRTTQAAERAANSNLTQASIMNLLSGAGQAGLTYNDQRRFDTAVSAEDRRDILEDTRSLLLALLP